jgi:hypothetical protein
VTNDEIPAGETVERPGSDEAKGIRYPDGLIEHPGALFEPKDIYLGRIIAALVASLGIVAGIYYGVWKFFWFQEHVQEAVKRSPYIVESSPSMKLPPQPRLEQLDRVNARERDLIRDEVANVDLAADERALHCYGSTTETGFVQIPIEQAIKALAGTLPVDREASPSRDANGLLDAGQSNSGRMFRGASP